GSSPRNCPPPPVSDEVPAPAARQPRRRRATGSACRTAPPTHRSRPIRRRRRAVPIGPACSPAAAHHRKCRNHEPDWTSLHLSSGVRSETKKSPRQVGSFDGDFFVAMPLATVVYTSFTVCRSTRRLITETSKTQE